MRRANQAVARLGAWALLPLVMGLWAAPSQAMPVPAGLRPLLLASDTPPPADVQRQAGQLRRYVALPATPAAPFEVTIRMPIMVRIWPADRSTWNTWARNKVESER